MWYLEKKILKNCAPKLLKKEFHKSGAKVQALHACWCDYLIIALPFWPSDENDWRALYLSVLCFDCMHRTKKQISSSQKLSQTHTRHSLFSLFPSEKLWVCIFFFFANILYMTTTCPQLWSLERKKHWDYEANYFFLLCSLQTLFSSRLSDLCHFPKFHWPTLHRHSLLFPRPAGASINGGFLLLHFQYWRWYALFMFLVSLSKFPEIFLFPFMEIFASHESLWFSLFVSVCAYFFIFKF